MSAGLPGGGGEPPLSNRWGHPFTPYPIQEAFMREAFDTLDKGGIGIFESPTGTGTRRAPARARASPRPLTTGLPSPPRARALQASRSR